jgi:hypothetical protein
MKGKGPPFYLNVIRCLKSFNTPGNEVAPGSDIVGKYFKYLGFSHVNLLKDIYERTVQIASVLS